MPAHELDRVLIGRPKGMPPDFPQGIRNTVDFKSLEGDRTELTVTEHDWPVGQMMEMTRTGLEQCLDKMAAIFGRSSG